MIVRTGLELVPVILFCLYTSPLGFEAAPLEFVHHQFSVARLVFGDQDAKWSGHKVSAIGAFLESYS